jgi:heme-binding protein
MARHALRTVVLALAVFGLFQLVRPARTNPPVDRTRTLQASVASFHPGVPVIERACENCHSNKTEWPWYSQVAPVSWVVANDVADARSAVNFSDWSMYGRDRQRNILNAACEEVMNRAMPLRSYTVVHPQRALTALDARAICDLAHVYSARVPDLETEPTVLEFPY